MNDLPQNIDPTTVQLKHHWFERVALKYIRDPRDMPFVLLMLSISFVVIPLACVMYIPGVVSPFLGLIYVLILMMCITDRYTLMLHNTSHRVLFKNQYIVLNHVIPWLLAPFCAQTPYTYVAHHMGMHHVEGNLGHDLSSTMRYQRDSLIHFIMYVSRFMLLSSVELPLYLYRRKKYKLFWRCCFGEYGYFAVVALLASMNLGATLCVFVIPFVVMRFGMMAGNWGQHAFIDASDPANPYRSAITCVNTRYNRRCFNDGYHIGHHVKASRHFTEMPGDLAANIETYRKEGAVVFDGIDFFAVWFLLMTKRYSTLARHLVVLKPELEPMTARISFLKSRTRACA